MNSNVIYQKYFFLEFLPYGWFWLTAGQRWHIFRGHLFLFLCSDRDWTGSIVPVYGDETSGYEENIICISDRVIYDGGNGIESKDKQPGCFKWWKRLRIKNNQ